MGVSGWKKLLTSRKELFVLLKVFKQGSRKYFKGLIVHLQDEMTELAAKHGLTLIESKTNTISLAMTLEHQVTPAETICLKICVLYDQIYFQGADATAVGSMLFTRGVSGTRVVTGKDSKIIGKSCHCSFFPNMIFISRWCSV